MNQRPTLNYDRSQASPGNRRAQRKRREARALACITAALAAGAGLAFAYGFMTGAADPSDSFSPFVLAGFLGFLTFVFGLFAGMRNLEARADSDVPR